MPSPSEPITRLYIVHAAEDRKLAAFLKSECEARVPNLAAFVASKAGQIPTGSDWLQEIHQNLRSATAFLFLLTPRSIVRQWVWYEVGAAFMSKLRAFPVAAAGLDRGTIPFPLKIAQTLVLDDEEDAKQLFVDLGGRLETPNAFCLRVRELSLPFPKAEIDEGTARKAQEALGDLGDPPKHLLRRMLALDGLSRAEMADELRKKSFVSDGISVERMLNALKDRQLIDGNLEGRWTVRPLLRGLVARSLEPPNLSARLVHLSNELLDWVQDENGLIDTSTFEGTFRAKINLLREKVEREHAEGDPMLKAQPSSAGGVKLIASALQEVAKRLPD